MTGTKVHRVVLLIVDHDNLGARAVREQLENVRYPNHCIGPGVIEIQTELVEWRDDHPLNSGDTLRQRDAFDKLFHQGQYAPDET